MNTYNNEPLFLAVKKSNRILANAIIDEYAREHSYREALCDIVTPIMYTLGELWLKEETTLAQTYVAAKISEDTLNKAIQKGEYEETSSDNHRVAVIGNVEDDFHSLGRKLVGTFLSASGWEVIDLGNDVSPAEFVETAVSHGSHVIGVSAMMYSTAQNVENISAILARRNLKNDIKLAVGGAVFKLTPTLVKEVGGDGTASNATDAPRLFNELFEYREGR